jgi:AraC-like DNA-binding protein
VLTRQADKVAAELGGVDGLVLSTAFSSWVVYRALRAPVGEDHRVTPDSYQECPAPIRLAGVVACLWRHEVCAAWEQRVLPDGCLDLIWMNGAVHVAGPDTATALVAAVASRVTEPDRALGAVLARLREGSGVRTTADALGWTERALHRRCRDAFGYGPSVLRRILRFRMALRLARQGVPFAATAARAGYADQAHLAREVRALAGVPLSQLLTANGANRSTPTPSGSCTTA